MNPHKKKKIKIFVENKYYKFDNNFFTWQWLTKYIFPSIYKHPQAPNFFFSIVLHIFNHFAFSNIYTSLKKNKKSPSSKKYSTVWSKVMCDSKHSVIQSTVWCKVQCDAKYSVMQSTVWCKVQWDAKYSGIQSTAWYIVQCDAKYIMMQSTL